ncbi:MAG: hypothetical protein WD737_10960 [Gemmatimonadota bacterium]
MTDDKSQLRKEIRYLQSESVWLQKALFALRKAEAAREKQTDDQGEPEPYAFSLGERTVVLEDLEEALDKRVELLMQTVRDMRQTLR